MKQRLPRLIAELGTLGLAAGAILAGVTLFFAFVLAPMQEKSRSLQSRLAATPAYAGVSAAPAGSEKLHSVYGYLAKGEETTDWLAKLYGIGAATGVELRSASYKSEQAGRLERYEIVLPLTGSYVQMRDFLRRSLAEIPVLSLDQISLKREGRREGAVQAEVRLTLHRVKSHAG